MQIKRESGQRKRLNLNWERRGSHDVEVRRKRDKLGGVIPVKFAVNGLRLCLMRI